MVMNQHSEARYIVESDNHGFIGRVYDLGGMVGLSFNSYDEIAILPDCLYAFEVDGWLSSLTRRVESLNLVGDMLWPECFLEVFEDFPVSKYEWCNVITDVFLMRFVSVTDCCLLLSNAVLECGLDAKNSTLGNLRKLTDNLAIVDSSGRIQHIQRDHRVERNKRFHRGVEREFTDDDHTFKSVSIFEFRGTDLTGTDKHGREIDLAKFFRNAIDVLRSDFNKSCRLLSEGLCILYDELGDEFKQRFSHKMASHGRDHPIYGSQRES